MIIEISNRTKSKLPLSLTQLEGLIKKFLLGRRLSTKEISLVLVGDTLMRRLNRETRGKDKVTDVLSFREADTDSIRPNFLGEVVIDYQQIKRQVKTFKTSPRQELIFILVHGLLHLEGYDDETDKEAKVMEELGKKFIAKL
jgi:probable rRNA maturation factor